MPECYECGCDYTDFSQDFEPGTRRCWQCAAVAYRKGLERMTAERDGALAVVAAEQKTRSEGMEIVVKLRAEVERRDGMLRRWLTSPGTASMVEHADACDLGGTHCGAANVDVRLVRDTRAALAKGEG